MTTNNKKEIPSMSLFAGIEVSNSDEVVTQSSGKKYLEVGIHEDLVITSITVKSENCNSDATWAVLQLELVKEGFEPFKHFLTLPKNNIELFNNSKETAEIMLRNLGNFFASIGLEASTKGDIAKLVATCFGDLSTLVGCKVGVVLGHGKKAHSAYLSRGVYQVVDPEGKTIMNDDGETPVVFDNAKSAVAFLTEVYGEKKVSRFANVKKFNPPTVPNPLSKLGGKKAKPKVAGIELDDSDLI